MAMISIPLVSASLCLAAIRTSRLLPREFLRLIIVSAVMTAAFVRVAQGQYSNPDILGKDPPASRLLMIYC
jgi:hypothetical protein